MHTERIIQQESRGKSYASHYNVVPWRKQQSSASFDGGRSQGNAARSFPSNGTSKMVASIGSFLATKQQPITSTVDLIEVSVTTSSTRTREIVCHKCHGRGHIAAQCPSRRTMLLNEKCEWELDSDPEDDGLNFDEEIQQGENEIQPEEGDHNCFISLRVLSVTAEREENG
jgi:hypothetical protein